MNVLSLFDGISCGRYCLDRLREPVTYYASEINGPVEQISKKNYPDIIRLGDVTNWRDWPLDWSSIDLLIAGSPCQGFSTAGKAGGTKAIINGEHVVIDSRNRYMMAKSIGAEFLSESHLFWEFILILDHVKAYNPRVRFMLENVKMSGNNMDMITKAVGVEPVFINSALVSAQNRQRHYWCNWKVPQPADMGIMLADILETTVSAEYDHTPEAIAYMNRVGSTGRVKWSYAFHSDTEKGKSQCVTSNFLKGVPNNMLIVRPAAMVGRKIRQKDTLYSDLEPGRYVASEHTTRYRKFTPIECERLQGLPDNYTGCIDSKIYIPYNSEEFQNSKGVDLCNVKLMDVNENPKPKNMASCALCTIKGLSNTGKPNYQLLKTIEKRSVSIVIQRLATKVVVQEDYVIDITKTGLDTETLCTQIKYVLNLDQEVTKKEFLVRTHTGTLLKITLVEDCPEMKLFIMLIVINLITTLKICTFVTDKANIHFCIDSLKESPVNSYNVVLSSLRMEITKQIVSNTQRYMMIGNGWQCDTIIHIFFWLLVDMAGDK